MIKSKIFNKANNYIKRLDDDLPQAPGNLAAPPQQPNDMKKENQPKKPAMPKPKIIVVKDKPPEEPKPTETETDVAASLFGDYL